MNLLDDAAVIDAVRGRASRTALDVGCGEGWREGSWAGFSADFADAPPWYFGTLESWVALFRENGLRLLEIREPVHPRTGKPLSVILVDVRD